MIKFNNFKFPKPFMRISFIKKNKRIEEVNIKELKLQKLTKKNRKFQNSGKSFMFSLFGSLKGRPCQPPQPPPAHLPHKQLASLPDLADGERANFTTTHTFFKGGLGSRNNVQ